MSAGTYNTPLLRMVNTKTKDTTNGQQVEEWTITPGAYLWCAVESVNSRVRTDYGSAQTTQEATIRVRNYPTLTALDRLRDASDGTTWVIDSLYTGDNEIVCDCHAWDALEDA